MRQYIAITVLVIFLVTGLSWTVMAEDGDGDGEVQGGAAAQEPSRD